MKKYKITWISKDFAESEVRANSLAEARQKADESEDKEFAIIKCMGYWEVAEIVEVEQNYQKDTDTPTTHKTTKKIRLRPESDIIRELQKEKRK